MTEILCNRCGKPLAEDDRGRYYAHVCKDCCDKHGLCQDCGGSVILTWDQAKNFACTGWHHMDFSTAPKNDPFYLQLQTTCPECGHKFIT